MLMMNTTQHNHGDQDQPEAGKVQRGVAVVVAHVDVEANGCLVEQIVENRQVAIVGCRVQRRPAFGILLADNLLFHSEHEAIRLVRVKRNKTQLQECQV